jgi:hypothetical protein
MDCHRKPPSLRLVPCAGTCVLSTIKQLAPARCSRTSSARCLPLSCRAQVGLCALRLNLTFQDVWPLYSCSIGTGRRSRASQITPTLALSFILWRRGGGRGGPVSIQSVEFGFQSKQVSHVLFDLLPQQNVNSSLIKSMGGSLFASDSTQRLYSRRRLVRWIASCRRLRSVAPRHQHKQERRPCIPRVA